MGFGHHRSWQEGVESSPPFTIVGAPSMHEGLVPGHYLFLINNVGDNTPLLLGQRSNRRISSLLLVGWYIVGFSICGHIGSSYRNYLSSVPSPTLGYIANYLAELTLVEYSFLKFLPSVIAASAVFLARWTMDQSDHPWNHTLEHYTSYKALDLQTAVLGMQDLQQNSCGSFLKAIRDKYLQEKYGRVADRVPPRLSASMF
ncbi:Cyclin-A2-1 [Platanthera guangdongensis]|uniref:Cyclin-A2-1 n=1 Tax=Platanthera guangdongensis TaxID=2320717 RepID=A0ABR2N2X6_9ASPA